MTVLMPYISLHIFLFLFLFYKLLWTIEVGFFQKHDSSLQIASNFRIILELKEENLFTPPVNHSKPVNFCFLAFQMCIFVCVYTYVSCNWALTWDNRPFL